MLFLNSSLLFGLVALAVPILIHLLNRKAAKRLEWGAMQFLLDSLSSRRRRILIEEILLLACRCLLLALIVLAIARPFVPAASEVPWLVVMPMLLGGVLLFGISFALWRYPRTRWTLAIGAVVVFVAAFALVGLEKWLNLRRFGGRGIRDIALVIDGSTSMSMLRDGTTNFERAQQEAERIIRTAPLKTAFSIVVAGPAPHSKVPAPISDRKELLATIHELRPTGGTMQALDALAAAAVSLAQGYHVNKQIVLLTDGQRAGWDVGRPARWTSLARTIEHLPVPPQIVVRLLGLPSRYRNVALSDITLSRDVVGRDRKVRIEVRIENTGVESITPSRVTLQVGQKELTDSTATQLAPGGAETFGFYHHFDREGSELLKARVVVDDDLPGDDAFERVVTVLRQIRVLIVDGNPAGRFIERSGAFTALALAPDARTSKRSAETAREGSKEGGFLVEPEFVDAPDIAGVERFDAYQVVILADVPRLPDAVANRLAEYVERGGGLLVGAGRRSMPTFYNDWTVDGGGYVTPAVLEERVETADEANAATPSITTFTHHALRSFADEDRNDLGTARITSYWRMSTRIGREDTAPGARLSTGDAWIAESKVGDGVVLMLACSLDTRDGNLATRQAFVPFIHEMVYYLADPGLPRLNIMPGHEIALRFPLHPPGASLAKKGDKPKVDETHVTAALGPDGLARQAGFTVQGEHIWASVGGDVVPGAYSLAVPPALAERLAWIEGEDRTIPFAVSRQVAESSLSSLTTADHEFFRGYGNFLAADNEDALQSLMAGKAFGEDLWRPLAVAALVLLLAEIALTRWIAVHRKTGRETAVTFESDTAPSASFRAQLASVRAKRAAG